MKALEQIRSPFHYMGNKKKVLKNGLLSAIQVDGMFFDLTVGGGSVLYNAPRGLGIDIDPIVIRMHNHLKNSDAINMIQDVYQKYFPKGLEENSYYRLRAKENELWAETKADCLFNSSHSLHMSILFVLTQLSFNSLFRFGPHGYNVPYGHAQKEFDITRIMEAQKVSIEKNLTFECASIVNIHSNLFVPGDTVYIDPPYFIATESYNYQGWPAKKEQAMRKLIEDIILRGVDVILSNVAFYRGHANRNLLDWSRRIGLRVYVVPGVSYKSWNNVEAVTSLGKTVEILITSKVLPLEELL